MIIDKQSTIPQEGFVIKPINPLPGPLKKFSTPWSCPPLEFCLNTTPDKAKRHTLNKFDEDRIIDSGKSLPPSEDNQFFFFVSSCCMTVCKAVPKRAAKSVAEPDGPPASWPRSPSAPALIPSENSSGTPEFS